MEGQQGRSPPPPRFPTGLTIDGTAFLKPQHRSFFSAPPTVIRRVGHISKPTEGSLEVGLNPPAEPGGFWRVDAAASLPSPLRLGLFEMWTRESK